MPSNLFGWYSLSKFTDALQSINQALQTTPSTPWDTVVTQWQSCVDLMRVFIDAVEKDAWLGQWLRAICEEAEEAIQAKHDDYLKWLIQYITWECTKLQQYHDRVDLVEPRCSDYSWIARALRVDFFNQWISRNPAAVKQWCPELQSLQCCVNCAFWRESKFQSGAAHPPLTKPLPIEYFRNSTWTGTCYCHPPKVQVVLDTTEGRIDSHTRSFTISCGLLTRHTKTTEQTISDIRLQHHTTQVQTRPTSNWNDTCRFYSANKTESVLTHSE